MPFSPISEIPFHVFRVPVLSESLNYGKGEHAIPRSATDLFDRPLFIYNNVRYPAKGVKVAAYCH
jgi:hypothetical protein